MDNSIKSWLYDIQVAINEINCFFENYINDIKTKKKYNK